MCIRRRPSPRFSIRSPGSSGERLRGAPAPVVLAFLEELGRPVRAVYEAGPSRFGLARAAAERGVDVRVVAPGSIPGRPGTG